MYDPEMRKDCPMRETNGNCSPVGGFCMDAVSDEICEAVHNAYQHGYGHALALRKEQEAKYPVCEKCGKKIDHIITSVFNYDGSDSEYSFPITYNEDGGCIQFSTTRNWNGYELIDEEQKDGIRCPFCHEFPFDVNEEIELYEPEEVVVMMWEGR